MQFSYDLTDFELKNNSSPVIVCTKPPDLTLNKLKPLNVLTIVKTLAFRFQRPVLHAGDPANGCPVVTPASNPEPHAFGRLQRQHEPRKAKETPQLQAELQKERRQDQGTEGQLGRRPAGQVHQGDVRQIAHAQPQVEREVQIVSLINKSIRLLYARISFCIFLMNIVILTNYFIVYIVFYMP